MAEKLKQSSVQIYDKKQNFPKNITQQNITSKYQKKKKKKIELQTIDISIGEQIL